MSSYKVLLGYAGRNDWEISDVFAEEVICEVSAERWTVICQEWQWGERERNCMTVDKFVVCVKDKRSLNGARTWVMGWGEVGTGERNLCQQSWCWREKKTEIDKDWHKVDLRLGLETGWTRYSRKHGDWEFWGKYQWFHFLNHLFLKYLSYYFLNNLSNYFLIVIWVSILF